MLKNGVAKHSNHMVLRRGFSLLEIMIASMILVVGILGVLSGIGTVENVRRDMIYQKDIDDVLVKIRNRIENCPWSELRSLDAPWTYGRYVNESKIASVIPITDRVYDRVVPMSENASQPQDCLLKTVSQGQLTGAKGLGILDHPSGIPNLKIYVEWYRGTSIDIDSDNTIGSGEYGYFTDSGKTLSVEESESYKDVSSLDKSYLPYLEKNQPGSLVDQDATLLVRIILTYGDETKPLRKETTISRRRN